MSSPIACNVTCCPEAEDINIPGAVGPTGAAGAAGTNGTNAYSFLTANLTVTSSGETGLSAAVTSSAMFAIGQTLFISDGTNFATFRVTAKPSAIGLTLTHVSAAGGTAPPFIITGTGTQMVVPGGVPPTVPVTVANGGTSVATLTDRSVLIGRGTAAVEFAVPGTTGQPLLSTGAATNPAFSSIQAAVTAWGLKKTPLSVYAAGTAAPFPNATALLNFGTTDPTLTLDAAGTYLLFANVRVDYTAATFAASQTVTVKLRRTNNTAADVTGATRSVLTDIITTLTYTLGVVSIPPVVYVTTNTNDLIEMWGVVTVLPSAGTLDAVQAEIVAIRLFDQTL